MEEVRSAATMEEVVDQLQWKNVVVLDADGRSSWPDPMEKVVHQLQWKK